MTKPDLTRAERKAFDLLCRAASAILELPELHPSERVETERDIHALQYRLLARGQLRKLGWP